LGVAAKAPTEERGRISSGRTTPQSGCDGSPTTVIKGKNSDETMSRKGKEGTRETPCIEPRGAVQSRVVDVALGPRRGRLT